MVPEPLWERVNAVDSNGWVLATVVGAPFGAVFAQLLGFETAMAIIAVAYLAAALVMIGAPDPRTEVASTGSLLRDAWLGLVYTWNNRTLRALAISLSTMNLAGGMIEIVVPVLILKHLGMGQDTVGYMFGLMGAFGVVSAFLSGRHQDRRTGEAHDPDPGRRLHPGDGDPAVAGEPASDRSLDGSRRAV